MLVELTCDKFQECGTMRPTILFKPGLNVVLGDDSATNSIGKSTFLLILDFIFGGADYVEKINDAVIHIGDHKFYFSFMFNDEQFNFSRDTINPNTVYYIKSSTEPPEEWTLENYKKFLLKQYKLDGLNLSFREIVSRFIRVYHRETINEARPLDLSTKPKAKEGIEFLEKIFGCYDRLKECLESLEKNEAEYKALKDSFKYGFLEKIPNKTLYKKKKEERKEKENRKKVFIPTSDFVNKSKEEIENICKLRQELKIKRAKKSRLVDKIKCLEEQKCAPKIKFESDFSGFLEFFPSVSLKKIEEIEKFHSNLFTILSSEIESELLKTQTELLDVEAKIVELTNCLEEAGDESTISKKSLNEYAQLTSEIENLSNQLEYYEKENALKEDVKTLKNRYDKMSEEELKNIENKINFTMAEMDSKIYEGKKPPCISLTSDKYKFETTDDGGTGTAYKSMAVLDLALLRLTQLPMIVHDSLIFKNIGDMPLSKLIQLYKNAGKQIFIALDKVTSYDLQTQEILLDSKILSLSGGEHSLFGISWSSQN